MCACAFVKHIQVVISLMTFVYRFELFCNLFENLNFQTFRVESVVHSAHIQLALRIVL